MIAVFPIRRGPATSTWLPSSRRSTSRRRYASRPTRSAAGTGPPTGKYGLTVVRSRARSIPRIIHQMYQSATHDAYSATCDDSGMPFIGLIVAIAAAGAAATLWLARPLPVDPKRREALTEAGPALDPALGGELALITQVDQTPP